MRDTTSTEPAASVKAISWDPGSSANGPRMSPTTASAATSRSSTDTATVASGRARTTVTLAGDAAGSAAAAAPTLGRQQACNKKCSDDPHLSPRTWSLVPVRGPQGGRPRQSPNQVKARSGPKSQVRPAEPAGWSRGRRTGAVARDGAGALLDDEVSKSAGSAGSSSSARNIAWRLLSDPCAKCSDGAWPTTRRCPPGATASHRRRVTSTIGRRAGAGSGRSPGRRCGRRPRTSGRRRCSQSVRSATPAWSACLAARARPAVEKSAPVTRQPRWASQMTSPPSPQPTSSAVPGDQPGHLRDQLGVGVPAPDVARAAVPLLPPAGSNRSAAWSLSGLWCGCASSSCPPGCSLAHRLANLLAKSAIQGERRARLRRS